MTDKEWIAMVKQITDPYIMLQTIVDSEQYLGFDPYYKDLRDAMLNQAEYIATKGGLA